MLFSGKNQVENEWDNVGSYGYLDDSILALVQLVPRNGSDPINSDAVPLLAITSAFSKPSTVQCPGIQNQNNLVKDTEL